MLHLVEVNAQPGSKFEYVPSNLYLIESFGRPEITQSQASARRASPKQHYVIAGVYMQGVSPFDWRDVIVC